MMKWNKNGFDEVKKLIITKRNYNPIFCPFLLDFFFWKNADFHCGQRCIAIYFYLSHYTYIFTKTVNKKYETNKTWKKFSKWNWKRQLIKNKNEMDFSSVTTVFFCFPTFFINCIVAANKQISSREKKHSN